MKLKGNVVIIDEAHNLLDTISSVHSVEINGLHVRIVYVYVMISYHLKVSASLAVVVVLLTVLVSDLVTN